ncbi:MAG: hypothetical protein HDT28_04845 [Clostridiales bacterium]|nr:hypothetical protein [Clostridiales bacterium]
MKSYEIVFLKDNYRGDRPCLSLSEIRGEETQEEFETLDAAREALFEIGSVEGYTAAIREIEDGEVLQVIENWEADYKVEAFDIEEHSLMVAYFINEKEALSYAEGISEDYYNVVVSNRDMFGKYIPSHDYTNGSHTQY